MTPQIAFRKAVLADAPQLSQLVFASGEQEFGFLFGGSEADSLRFLTHATQARMGRFSYRRHWVALTDASKESETPTLLAVLAPHSSATTLPDNLAFAWMSLQCFGLVRTIAIIRRGLTLEHELPPPASKEILLAHCATLASHRGKGIFTALFKAALPNILPAGHTLVLDVLKHNNDAARLYARLGFIATTRKNGPTRGLPEKLASTRMRRAEQ